MKITLDKARELLEAMGYEVAEQAEQEPVAWMGLHKELGKLRWMGGDEGWDNAINAVRDRLIELYTAEQTVNQEPCIECGRPTMSAESKCDDCHSMDDAAPVQQVTRADLKAAFKEGFERAADLYAPNDGQEPYAYEVWDVQDQSFTMIYATQLKEFNWIEPENIARVLYAAPQPVMQEPVCCDKCGSKLGTTVVPCDCAAPMQQAEQEPVGWNDLDDYELAEKLGWRIGDPLYMTAVGLGQEAIHHFKAKNTAHVRTKDLTDDELADACGWKLGDPMYEWVVDIGRWAIAADRSKNK